MMLLIIESQSVVNWSCVYIRWWGVDWCVWMWMVSLGGIHCGSLEAFISGLIRFAHLDGPGLAGLHHSVHLCIDCIFTIIDGNILHVLHWYQAVLTMHCWKGYHYWHLRERNCSRNWVRSDSQCHVASFWVQMGESDTSHTIHMDMCSECIVIECWQVSSIMFKFHFDLCSQIPWEASEEHVHHWVLSQSYHSSLDSSHSVIKCLMFILTPSCIVSDQHCRNIANDVSSHQVTSSARWEASVYIPKLAAICHCNDWSVHCFLE